MTNKKKQDSNLNKDDVPFEIDDNENQNDSKDDINLLIEENKKLKAEIEELKNKQDKKEKHGIEKIEDYNVCFIKTGTGDYSFQFKDKIYSISNLKGQYMLISNKLLKENPKLNNYIQIYSNKISIIK